MLFGYCGAFRRVVGDGGFGGGVFSPTGADRSGLMGDNLSDDYSVR